MKKFSNFLLNRLAAAAVLVMACSLSAAAYDFMVDSISYNIIGDNEVEVTYNDSIKLRGEVYLPATVVNDGITYQVTRLGYNAFRACNEMTLIDIPEGVTVIGTFAFNGCNQLQYMELPNSLTTIEKSAFFNCVSLTDFHVPRNLTNIAYNAFSSCGGIKYFTCSSMNPVYRAVDGILYSKDLTTLVAYPPASPATTFDIPSHVTTLYDYCLHNCDNLTQVTIPESVTAMGMNIFSGCDGIESIYIPDGVTRMGVTVFGNCSKLSQVHLPASADSLLSSFFYNCPMLTEVTIPRNIRYIGTFAFSESRNLKTVNFEEGSRLNYIALRAFDECKSLESFIMPDSVTVLEGEILGYCTSLKEVHLSNNLQILAGATFWGCTALTELDIPGTITFMGNAAVCNCSSLKRVKIGDKDSQPGITYLDNCALMSCDNLEKIELGANIDSLYSYALDVPRSVKVFICWSPTAIKTGEYSGIYPSATAVLYVPRVTLEDYRNSPHWSRFKTIVPIEDVGDVDGNGIINIADVSSLIDHLLGGETDFSAPLADVDLDGNINISDVSALIDYLLRN